MVVFTRGEQESVALHVLPFSAPAHPRRIVHTSLLCVLCDVFDTTRWKPRTSSSVVGVGVPCWPAAETTGRRTPPSLEKQRWDGRSW
jgi:hypothetical protein